MRGQDKFLIGNNTSKVDKKLEIPPLIARKPRMGAELATSDPRVMEAAAAGGGGGMGSGVNVTL